MVQEMMHAARRFLNWLTPGTRWLLAAWVIGFGLSFSPAAPALALSGPAVRHGQIWRAVSYGFLPYSFMDFLLGGVAFALLGTTLERRWTARTLLAYALFVIAATGLSWAMFPGVDSRLWRGGGPLFFGMLAAWGRLCGDETVFLAPSLSMKSAKAALIFGGISLLAATLSTGWRNAAFAGSGAVWGLVHLGVRTKLGESADHPAPSGQRISRLEL